jgi:hypothetical protein
MATLELEAPTAAGVPEPGIYPDVEAHYYHRWEAASNSALSHLLRSPAHLRAALDHPKPPTEEQALGTAAHTLILESDSFRDLYTVAEQCAAVTGKGEPCSNPGRVQIGGAWYCGTHLKGKEGATDTRTVLAPDAWEKVNRMAEAVLSHPAASVLLALAGDTEVSLVWDDPATGVRCKGRPDRLCGSERLVVDLKTTTDAGREEFTRSIFKWGYHRQAAHYIDGLAAHEVAITDYVIIAMEKTEPFGVAVYRLKDDAVEAGRAQLRALLSTYRWCAERGEWPGYPTEIQDITLPRWAWNLIESED